MSLELFVGLKIPDTTAITTFHVLERLGYKISKIKREIYYKFEVGDAEKFSKKVGKVDVLVNANKNKFSTELNKQEGAFYILVKDIDDALERVKFLKSINIDPFCQPYRDNKNTPPNIEQRRFARWVNHKALYNKLTWEEYKKSRGDGCI